MTIRALQLSGIRKRFSRVVALDAVDLVVGKGTIHALLGENGAGKTTLMRIAFGLTMPDEGTMIGDARSLATAQPTRRPADSVPSHGEPVVRAEGMTIRDARGVAIVREASLRVDRGEILGVAGVAGSGAKEVLHAIAGRLRPSGGTLQLPNAIGFIPEDRQHDALLMDESVAANVALHDAGKRRGWLRRGWRPPRNAWGAKTKSRPAMSARRSRRFRVDQQRLTAARELADGPALLVAVNPTRGLDVVATASIQQQLRDAASGGMAVVYYTADLDELIDIADRVVVVFDGRVREVARDRDAVGRAMLGAA